MTQPLVTYVAAAGQRDFDVPFPYIAPQDVEVRVNGSLVPTLEWVTQSRLRLATPPGAGATVEVRRNTPISQALVDFQNGAILTEEDLNLAIRQLLFNQQEIEAFYQGKLEQAIVRVGNANGVTTTPEGLLNELASMVLGSDLLATFQQRINDIDNNAALITILDGSLQQTNATIANPLSGNGALKTALDDLRIDHESLEGVVNGLIDLGNGEGIATIIQNETDARIAGDTALAADIALIGAKSGDALSFILDLTRVRVSPTETLGTRLSTIATSIGNNAAAITNESTTRASAISAEATARQQLGAALQTAINNETASRTAAITNEQNARTTAIAAEATARQQLGATLTNSINGEASTRAAAILAEQNARATAIAAEASARQTLAAALTADIDNVESTLQAQITNEQTARTTAIAAEATARQNLQAVLSADIDAVEGSVSTLTASVNNESTARINGDNALASTISLIGAKNGAGTAFILSDSTVQLTGGVTLASRLTGLQTQISSNTSAIINEQTTRANAISAEASTRNSQIAALELDLEGQIAGAYSAIASETSARTTAISAETSARNTQIAALELDLENQIASVSAAVSTEATTRASQDSALSTQINTVSTNLNGLSATVSTVSSSVDGLLARYGVTLNVNGYITGFAQNNNGTSGDFIIMADKFKVVSPGVTPRDIFTVDANGVSMTGNVKINGGLIVSGTVGTGSLAANAVTQFDQELNWNLVIARTNTGMVDSPGVDIANPTGSVKVDVSCFLTVGTFANDTAVDVQLIRISGGTTTYIGQPFSRSFGESGYLTFFAMDVPPAGVPVTYKLRMTKPSGGDAATISGGQLLAVEYKK